MCSRNDRTASDKAEKSSGSDDHVASVQHDPDLLRHVPDKAPLWVLDGLIAKGCVSMIAAPMSMHKTNVGVWAATEASIGTPLALDKPHVVWLNEQEGDISMQVRPRLM